MLTVLGPLLAAGGFGLYFLSTFRLARYRSRPWEFVALVAAGAALGAYRLAAAPSAATAAAAALALGILVFACWFFFSFSMYGEREDRPRIGERFPDFTLPTSDGRLFRLAEAHGRRLLLVCYRGIW